MPQNLLLNEVKEIFEKQFLTFLGDRTHKDHITLSGLVHIILNNLDLFIGLDKK